MALSLLRTALGCRCPRCGRGPVFEGLLTVRETCLACGLDMRALDTGDGPVVLVILLLGTIVVGLAFWVEFAFAPPLWVHAVLWPVVTVPLAVLLMRPMKAWFVAAQYRYMSA